MLLHGEQYVEWYKPVPTSGMVHSKLKIRAIVDRGSGTAVVVETVSLDSNQEPFCLKQYLLFIRGLSGAGSHSSAKPVLVLESKIPPVPTSPPTLVVREATQTAQAALYRLNGDMNPLHIDPQMAAMGGFDVPILHGLCTLGIVGRQIFEAFGDRRPCSFRRCKARFVKHVFPGETLQTELWRSGSEVIFQASVVERKSIVLVGFVELASEPRRQPVADPKSTIPRSDSEKTSNSLMSSVYFRALDAVTSKLDGELAKVMIKTCYHSARGFLTETMRCRSRQRPSSQSPIYLAKSHSGPFSFRMGCGRYEPESRRLNRRT